jgi:uncharacterized membrane-anchored protein
VKAILVAHGADLATFLVAVGLVRVPIELEVNPAAVLAYSIAGLAGVAAYKVGLVAVLAVAFRRIRTKPKAPAIVVGAAVGAVGAAANILAIASIG